MRRRVRSNSRSEGSSKRKTGARLAGRPLHYIRMEFRLVYRGKLKANAANAADKQEVRRAFHPQLRKLWQQLPLNAEPGWLRREPQTDFSILKDQGLFTFAPLVSTGLSLIAELAIIFLRPQEPGFLITQGGDIDNRIKTLLDARRMPKAGELPAGAAPRDGETPFFCLLEDDALVTALAVTTDRLLEDADDPQQVHLVIHVRAHATKVTWGNIGLIG
jgi:hypothetical protein